MRGMGIDLIVEGMQVGDGGIQNKLVDEAWRSGKRKLTQQGDRFKIFRSEGFQIGNGAQGTAAPYLFAVADPITAETELKPRQRLVKKGYRTLPRVIEVSRAFRSRGAADFPTLPGSSPDRP